MMVSIIDNLNIKRWYFQEKPKHSVQTYSSFICECSGEGKRWVFLVDLVSFSVRKLSTP